MNQKSGEKTALITLDLINEICHQDGKLARYADRIAEKKLIEKTNKLTAWGRRQDNYLIIHVRVGFRPHYQDASKVSPIFSQAKKFGALNLDEWGGHFCDELVREDNDIIINKHRVSAFYGTDLDLILRANCVERIMLCGVATNNAVELTAREAHDRDYKVTVLSDLTETASEEEQRASLSFMGKIADVVESSSILL